jgi:hypothetical protein
VNPLPLTRGKADGRVRDISRWTVRKDQQNLLIT